MVKELNPSIYKNLKYSVLPENAIDTINVAPITNIYETEPSIITTEESPDITAVIIDGTEFNFSNLVHGGAQVAAFDNIVPTYRRCVHESHTYFFQNRKYAKARTDVLMYTGNKTFTTTAPITGNISATILLTWTSSAKDKGAEIDFDNSPSVEQLNNNNYSLANWIRQNSSAKNTNNWTYNTNNFSSNPWGIPDPSVADSQKVRIITNWYESGGITSPAILGWQENANYQLSGATFTYLNDISNGLGLEMTDDSISISATVDKLDDYHVRVNYTVPIRFSYFALSRKQQLIGYDQIDSWAFVDRISKITIQLNGYALNLTKNEKQYSLTEDGQLTTNVKNNNNYTITSSELLTLSAYTRGLVTDVAWYEYITKLILTKYKKGKYIAFVDVPASWAIKRYIHINDEIIIIKTGGYPIQRNGTPTTFLVKTITKKLKNNEYTYSLGLMEE